MVWSGDNKNNPIAVFRGAKNVSLFSEWSVVRRRWVVRQLAERHSFALCGYAAVGREWCCNDYNNKACPRAGFAWYD
jgi:hypothetical protein